MYGRMLFFLSLLAIAIAIGTAPVLSQHQQQQQQQRLLSSSGSRKSIKNLKDKIKNVVFIIMENRSVDNVLGGQRIKGLDNPINKGPFCNPFDLGIYAEGMDMKSVHDQVDEKGRSQDWVCSMPKDFDSILDDPDHAIHGNNIEFYGTFTPDNKQIESGQLKPSLHGFVHEQVRLYDQRQTDKYLAQEVINYYTEEQVPVITALSHDFVVFNEFFSDIPGVCIRPLVISS